MPERMSENMSERMSEDMSERMSEDMSEGMPENMSERRSEIMPERLSELEASGRSSHCHWELWGVSVAMQSAIEEFAHKPGADGRSRGGNKEAEEEEEEGGGGDEADIKSTNPHPTDAQQGRCQHGCFEMSWWGYVEE